MLRWSLLWLALWVLVPLVVLQWQPVAIVGESMAPTIRAGDVVLADTRLTPEDGSVVTYDSGDGLITHRLRGRTADGRLRLRGDANSSNDAPVDPGSVFGVGRLVVPVAAAPVAWASSGNIAAVILCGLGLLVALGRAGSALRRHARVAAPGVLALAALAVLVPSQALLTGTTTNADNHFAVHQVPPATALTADCTRVGVTFTIDLDWVPSTSPIATGQQVQRSLDGGPWETQATTDNTVTEHADSGISVTGSYRYRIRTTTSTSLTATSAAVTVTVSPLAC